MGGFTRRKGVPIMKSRTKTAAIAAAVIVALLGIWAVAPGDLIPRWAALGTPTGSPTFLFERTQETSDQPDTHKDIVPEGFMADLVGMRLDDARAKVEALPGDQTLVVSQSNFLPRSGDSAFIPTRLSASVLLGRVIGVQARG
jgi:hypothetical protein